MVTPTEINRVFARRLGEAAKEAGLEPGALAKRAGLPEDRVQTLLTGEGSADLDELTVLARALEVDPAGLIRE